MSIFLSTGYCVGSVIAIILNLIIPEDPEDEVAVGDDAVHWSVIGQKSERFAATEDPALELEDSAGDDTAKEVLVETGDGSKDETSTEEHPEEAIVAEGDDAA